MAGLGTGAEGCGELAVRAGLSRACVKVRLHRSRRRVKDAVERRVRRRQILESDAGAVPGSGLRGTTVRGEDE